MDFLKAVCSHHTLQYIQATNDLYNLPMDDECRNTNSVMLKKDCQMLWMISLILQYKENHLSANPSKIQVCAFTRKRDAKRQLNVSFWHRS